MQQTGPVLWKTTFEQYSFRLEEQERSFVEVSWTGSFVDRKFRGQKFRGQTEVVLSRKRTQL
jgi:hypothetical protein